jgi:hypothetical protein
MIRLLAITALLVVASPPARAEGDPRVELPWAVRGEAFLLSGPGLFGATAGSVAATVQRTLWRRFAWEETIGYGAGNRDVGGKDIGWTLAGTARAAPWLSEKRTHALTMALGTALVLGGGYGTLHFVFAELGYEYRSAGGFTVMASAGPNLLLSTPKRDICDGHTWLCERFHRGELASVGHVRVGAGWAF